MLSESYIVASYKRGPKGRDVGMKRSAHALISTTGRNNSSVHLYKWIKHRRAEC
jgi:hypothetical protein